MRPAGGPRHLPLGRQPLAGGAFYQGQLRRDRVADPHPVLALAIANAGLEAWPDGWSAVLESIGTALLRGAALALGFLALRALYQRVRGREGIGLGDIKLAGVAGAWLGLVTIFAVIELAALTALGVYVVNGYLRQRPLKATAFLPFGAFLAPAIWIGWLAEALWIQGAF